MNMRNTKSLYIPLIGNGGGDVKLQFMAQWVQAVGNLQFILATSEDSLASRARNVQAAAFLKTDREYLLFWDADILATKQDIDHLCENDHDILCGIYCKKTVSLEPQPVFNTLPGTEPKPMGGLEEIARGGTGFMRIHRGVFEALKCPEIEYDNHGELQWDFFPVGIKNREYLSEDWFFCDNAREKGFKVILDTRIQLLHQGGATFPIDFAAIGLVPAPKEPDNIIQTPQPEPQQQASWTK